MDPLTRAAEAGELDTEMVTEMEEETYMTETYPQVLTHDQKVVELVQGVLREGRLSEESAWQAAVLIPKAEGD